MDNKTKNYSQLLACVNRRGGRRAWGPAMKIQGVFLLFKERLL